MISSRIKRILFVLTVLFLGAKTSYAQVFPIQSNVQFLPPYTPVLSAYTAPGAQRLLVQLRNNDVNFEDHQIKLRITLEGVGITIKTRANFVPQPLTLPGGGAPTIFYGEDIAEYFLADNLEFAGYSKREYQNSGKIPEGVYRFSVEVLDYNRSILLSNKGTTVVWMILNDPPLLSLPRNESKVQILNPPNLPFSWTPRHTGSPNSAFTTEYIFRLVEIWPANRNPYDAFLSMPPLYEVTTSQSQIIYGPAEPALIPGRKYAWQVQAIDTDGRDLFKNNGRSEVRVFQFGDELGVPENFRQELANQATLSLRWESPMEGEMPTQYRIRYKTTGGARWQETVTTQSWLTLAGLRPETEYEIQVRAERDARFGEYTLTQRFSTLQVSTNAAFSCGRPPEIIQPTSSELLLALSPGDLITCSDFSVVVTEITSGANGSYAGKGMMQVKMLNGASIGVTFSGTLNNKYEMTTGGIQSIYEQGSPMGQVIERMNTIGEEKPEPQQPKQEEEPDLSKAITHLIPVEVDNVVVASDGKIEVTSEDGTVTEYEQKKDEATGKPVPTIIQDASGDQWLVKKDETTGETKVTKVEGGTLVAGPGGATTAQSSERAHIRALAIDIAKEIRKELAELLNLPLNAPKLGAGPIHAAVFADLPACIREYENDPIAARAIFDYSGELQTNTTLQDDLSAILELDAGFTSIIDRNQQVFEKNTTGFKDLLSPQEWNLSQGEACEHLVLQAKKLYITDYLSSAGVAGECFTRGVVKGLTVMNFQASPLVALVEAGLCLTEREKCAGEGYWTQFSYGAANGLLQELDIMSMAEGLVMIVGSQLKNKFECLVQGGTVTVIITASTVEEAIHMFSKCVLGVDMTLEEYKAMYGKVKDYVANNWTDPYLHGQATVFVATIVIPFTKISAISKVRLLNKFKTSSKLSEFGSKIDELEKLSKVADEGGDIGKVMDNLAKGGAKLLDDVTLKSLTPEIPSGTFVNSTKFNNSALKIDPPANSQLKQLADDVKLNGDVDIPGGSKTEQIQDILYTDAGYTKLDGKVGSNQGLDGLYIKGDVKNPTEIIVGEAKQWSSSGGASLSPANANTGLPIQMSDNWIDNVANRIRNEANTISDPILKQQKIDVANMLQDPANLPKINKYLAVVNKSTGQVNILKLGSY